MSLVKMNMTVATQSLGLITFFQNNHSVARQIIRNMEKRLRHSPAEASKKTVAEKAWRRPRLFFFRYESASFLPTFTDRNTHSRTNTFERAIRLPYTRVLSSQGYSADTQMWNNVSIPPFSHLSFKYVLYSCNGGTIVPRLCMQSQYRMRYYKKDDYYQ